MSDIKYRVYPTLLNEYAKYLKNKSQENFRVLLNRINRVSDFDAETLLKFSKGINFEDAVIKNKPNNFDEKIILQTRQLLPPKYQSQVKLKFNHKNIQYYGIADVVGNKKVIDLKTTSSYKLEKFKDNFQNLYLYALKNQGFEQMQYIVYDFDKIHIETYSLACIDFNEMLLTMENFSVFLEENRALITDKKIFISPNTPSLFD